MISKVMHDTKDYVNVNKFHGTMISRCDKILNAPLVLRDFLQKSIFILEKR